MSTVDLEPEGSAFVADPARALQGLSQLATFSNPPLEAIRLILSSYGFPDSQENRKRSQQTDLEQAKSKKARNDSARPCKGNLNTHVKTAHATKRLVVIDVFECEVCECTFATQEALDAHVCPHEFSSTEARSPKYKCAFCSKERTSIYNHYGSQHMIDYPEQILFDNGKVLVWSDINTDNGKAPWFLKEKEKMNDIDNVTCRLCETETSFDNPEILGDHYTLYHKVEPAMLDNLQRLFRADKGVHLGLATSQTPKRKQTASISEKDKAKPETQNDKANLKSRVKKSILRDVFDCKECDQAFATKALLDKHKKDKHGPKIVEKAKSVKYKCALCRKEVAQIYKHYGNVHKIEYPEQILFDNGNVLVLAGIDTNNGRAPWFLSEKEKAETRYTLKTCRLCDTKYDFVDNTALLEKHYLNEHKVDPDVLDRLNNLRCMFRAAKGAHLADQPASRAAKRQHRIASQISRPVNKSESKSSEDGSAHAEGKEASGEWAGLITYQCAECDVAATTCDASVAHAQLHHLPGGYNPVTLPCDICSTAFEEQSYADHSSHHLNTNEFKIVKFQPSKLLNEWSEMFQGLSESHANRIKASSIYQYTRRIKMNPDVVAGTPLYQCAKCELYVRPKDVEGHCYSKTPCSENQSTGHYCPDCDIYFYSCAGLTAHEREHRTAHDCFRKVTFNCREDETLNQALKKLQSTTVEETPKKIQETNKRPVEILEMKQFCKECEKWLLVSESEAHAATHNKNAAFERDCNQRIEGEEAQQQQNCLNSGADQNAAVEAEGRNVEGTIELWNSDNDSCQSLQVCSNVVHADIHVQKKVEDVLQNPVETTDKNNDEAGATVDLQNAVNNSEVDPSQVRDIIRCDEFSEEMTHQLQRDIQNLVFKEFGVEMNKWAFIPDDLTDNLPDTLGNDAVNPNSSHYNTEGNLSQDFFSSHPNVSQVGDGNIQISPDIFSEKTQTEEDNMENNINLPNTANQVAIINVFKISGAANANIICESSFQNDDLESTSRPSSRVILNRMMSDDEPALL